MKKFQYIFRDQDSTDTGRFKSRILDDIVPALLARDPAALKVSMTDVPAPGLTVLPLRKDNLALVSVWSETDKLPDSWKTAGLPGLAIQGYEIDESVPVAYEKDWQDGQTSPGVVLLTLLKQNPRLTYDEFMHEWHGRHTPKAMRIHPFWNYIRNVIKGKTIASSPTFEGIVEEHFRTRSDCVNPVRMFGGPLKFLPHMVEVGLHARHFLDLKLTENYLLSETHIRSLNS